MDLEKKYPDTRSPNSLAAVALETWHNGCSLWHKLRGFMFAVVLEMLKIRPLRRFWHFIERVPPFFAAFFSPDGLASHEGRILIWGKVRRILLSSVPPLARALQKHYGLTGGCRSCGASCKLLFQCPHWDDRSHLCTVYSDRPNICRLFPITPADIRERDIVAKKKHLCGFKFE